MSVSFANSLRQGEEDILYVLYQEAFKSSFPTSILYFSPHYLLLQTNKKSVINECIQWKSDRPDYVGKEKAVITNSHHLPL